MKVLTKANSTKAQRRAQANSVKNRKVVNVKKVNVRTPSSIIRALATNSFSRTPKKASKYVMCRADPFHSFGGTGIPDGGNTDYIVIDSVMRDIITMGSGSTSFAIQTICALPTMAMFNPVSGATTKINGVLTTAPTQSNPNSTISSNAWIPISIVPAYAGRTYFPGQIGEDPYNASKARLVSVGYKLIYTGPVSTCSGSITVTPNNVAMQHLGQTVGASSVLSLDAMQVFAANIPANVPCVEMDVSVALNTMTHMSYTVRPEEGLLILPKHMTNDYKIRMCSDVSHCVLANSGLSSGTYYNQFAEISTFKGGIIWWDDDWENFLIVGNGINPDASFRFETVTCFEMNPQVGTLLSSLTLKNSPKRDQQALEAGNKVTQVQSASLGTESSMRGKNDPVGSNK